MSFNTFGHMFRVTTFGESHGPAIGCVVDGCPPGIALTEADIQPYLDQRRPGQSRFTTQRREPDEVKILSGVFNDAKRRPGHHRHADRAVDREYRPALQGLFRHQGQLPARARRLQLRHQVRPSRLSRRRPAIGARNRDAGRGRRGRAQDRARHDGARRADPDGRAQGRPRALGLGRGRRAIRSSVRTRRWRSAGRTISTTSASAARRSAPSSRWWRMAYRPAWARRSTASSTAIWPPR